MDKPVLYFSLLGRKASGKSCLFAALNAPKEVNKNHISICFAEETKQYKRVVNTLRKEAFLKRNDNLQRDKMGNILKENVEKIKNGELLDSTGLPEKYVYVFSLSAEDKFGTDLALLDYAGELLNNKGETNEYFNSMLKKMDGIFLLIGIPNTQKEEEDFNEEINKLTTAFKAIDIKRKDKSLLLNIPIVLLVSKFDRYIRKNNLDFDKLDIYEEHFKQSDVYKRLESLIQSVTNITENGMFKVFLTSAFGECSDKDIPVNRNLLKPINLLEPFDWAARKSAQLKTDECKKILKNGFWKTLFKDSTYFKQAYELMPIYPSDSENYKLLENINDTLEKQRSKRFVGIMGMLLMAYLGTDCYLDKSYLDKLSVAPKTEEECENRIIGLRKYLNDDYYRHFIAKLSFFTDNMAKARVSELQDSQHFMQIENLKNEKDHNKVVAKCDELLKKDPTRSNAEKIKEIKIKAETKLWDETAALFENELNRKLQANEPVRLKEVNVLSCKIDELEKTLPESRKIKLDDLKAIFGNFDTENRKKAWIVALNETEKLIMTANTTTDNLNEDASKEIQENIGNLQNTYQKTFDAEGNLNKQFETLKQNYEQLVRAKVLRAWEKLVNAFEAKLENLDKNKTNITDTKMIGLNRDLLNIKNNYKNEFDKADVIDKLAKRLTKIINDSKSREWNRNLDDILTKIKTYDNNNETTITVEEYEELDNSLNELNSKYETIFGEDSLNRFKTTRNLLETVFIESQKKAWRAKAVTLRNSIDGCLSKELDNGLTAINSLSTKLTALENDLTKNPNWNLNDEFVELRNFYDKTKSIIKLKILDKDFSLKLREATNFSHSNDEDDYVKAFDCLLEAELLLDRETLSEDSISSYSKRYFDTFANVFECVNKNIANGIKAYIETDDYMAARALVNKVMKSESYLLIVKKYNGENDVKELYENLIHHIDLMEFIKDYNALSDICSQSYREIFSSNNAMALTAFINKYKINTRKDFVQYVEEVKKLRDYISKGEAELCAKIISVKYPKTFSEPLFSFYDFSQTYTVTIEGSEDSGGYIRFVTSNPRNITAKAKCSGRYDGVTGFTGNPKLYYSGSASFDNDGKCNITMTCDNSNGDSDFYNATGFVELEIVSFNNVPQLGSLEIKDK